MRSRGFSLIEVLVALTIFAVMASAIVFRSGGFGDQVYRLEKQTMAHWVAENHADTLRAERAWISPGRQNIEVEMADRDWRIEQVVAATARDNLRRIDLVVTEYGRDEEVLATLTIFLGQH